VSRALSRIKGEAMAHKFNCKNKSNLIKSPAASEWRTERREQTSESGRGNAGALVLSNSYIRQKPNKNNINQGGK
jgi:hypothetical protein